MITEIRRTGKRDDITELSEEKRRNLYGGYEEESKKSTVFDSEREREREEDGRVKIESQNRIE